VDTALWDRVQAGESGIAKARAFADLVQKWTVRINLIARSTVPEIWTRHIEDSARLYACAPGNPALWADFGSGGGFPGIVAAIIAQSRQDRTQFVLVESDQRKATFLREAARQLAVPVRVISERAEVLGPLGADVVSARALAPLEALCGLAHRHMAADGVAIFPKGETFADEVAAARKNWRFDLETVIDPGHKGAILRLKSIGKIHD
jgi:16S rRNA (guanine527-N7)-methyltransferase